MRLVLRTILVLSVIITASLLATPSAQALDRKVEITNKTKYPLMNLYATRPNAPDSRKNHLPTSSRIPAGESKTINFDDKVAGAGSCMRDLEFDLTGYALRKGLLLLANVNVCQLSKIELGPCKADGGYCAKLSK